MDSVKRRNTRRKPRLSGLRASYGEVLLRKGTRLYHTSPVAICDDKPIIFTTFHPSEWYRNSDDVVSVIELQQDVSLLFMVQGIRHLRIFSALGNLLDKPGTNLMRLRIENLSRFQPWLACEQFDGWFSTKEGKTVVEVALINNPAVYKVVECAPIQWSWNNSTISSDGSLVPKKWGDVYPIVVPTPRMTLNARFRPQIAAYITEMTHDDPGGTAFSRILEEADIRYVDAAAALIKWM
jgi:hypothetical protein